MKQSDLETLVQRLHDLSQRDPRGYQTRVALLAGVGLLLLLAIITISAGLLLALVAVPIALVVSGGGMVLLLLLKLGKLIVVLAIPLWVLVRGSIQAAFVRFPRPEGRELKAADAPALFARLDWMRHRMHGPRFHHVLITDSMNASMVQRPLFGLFGFPRNFLILGMPLLEMLPESEALAVVAHEYGHLAGAHSRFGAFIYRLRLSWILIDAVARGWAGWGGRLLARVINAYAPYFNAYTFVLARSHEYLADAASAELLGRDTAANALKRVNVVGRDFGKFLDAQFDRVLQDPEPPPRLPHDWAARIAAAPAPAHASRYLAAALQRRTDLTDTHPALRDRLAALAAQIDTLPPRPAEPSAAVAWFGNRLDGLRDEMARTFTGRVRELWHQRRDELDQQRKRLSVLEAKDTLDRDEDRERLALRRKLFPEEDHVAAATTFLERHGDDPVGFYARGALRLQREDEGGLDDLEKAMQLDADAIVPACAAAADYLQERDAARMQAYVDRARAAQQAREKAGRNGQVA